MAVSSSSGAAVITERWWRDESRRYKVGSKRASLDAGLVVRRVGADYVALVAR
jgi:hypothetical protein